MGHCPEADGCGSAEYRRRPVGSSRPFLDGAVLSRRRLSARNGRRVVADHGPERYAKAIPCVDDDDGTGQVDQFFVRELGPRFVVHSVGHSAASDVGDCLGPGQSCAFSRAEERRFRAVLSR